MNFKRFHESRNLWSLYPNQTYRGVTFEFTNNTIKMNNTCTQEGNIGETINLKAGTYTIAANANINISQNTHILQIYKANVVSEILSLSDMISGKATFTIAEDTTDILIRIHVMNGVNYSGLEIQPMLNTGSTPLPYEPYSSEVWHDIPHYIHNTSTDTLTTLPAVIYPNDTTATIGLEGNTTQSGTPTPDNPIIPQGTGERTGNLFDITAATSGKYVRDTDGTFGNYADTSVTDYIDVSGISTLYPQYFTDARPVRQWGAFYDSSKTFVSGFSGYNRAITVPNDAVYVRLTADDSYISNFTVSSTELESYEPFGIKIPILSAGQTTPVYLGEVQSTRRIKKWVLDGTETWNKGNYAPTGGYQFFTPKPADISVYPDWLITHFKKGSGLNGSAFASYLSLYPEASILPENASANHFKAWLAAQYAAGTPITLWYILTEPETGIVNEPLMKIGDYADEVSGVSIPVTTGEDTLSIDTTVQPSEVTVNYKGWHPVQNTHVYPDSSWMPTSWEEFRKAVRSGKAQSLYPVGTKLYENWGDDTSNAWIVVDYPNDSRYIDTDLAQQGYTNRVMLMEEKLNYLRIFDNQEAWLYAETAIPAGTYRFTIPNYDTTYGGNKTYIFTSTTDVPVGGQLMLTWAYQQNPSAVQAYSSSTATSALFNVSIAEWDGTTPCTDLGTIKLAMGDADSTYGKLNHIHRTRYGSNNYAQSGIRQWLNSDAAANAWWQPTTIFDRPYSNRNTAGRLNTMNSDMKSVIATPTVDCITNNLFESPSLDGTTFALQTAYTVKDKLFLVTHTEINLSSAPNVDSILSYYTSAGNAERIKYRADNGNAYYWWLRSPLPTGASGVRSVHSSGALSGNYADSTFGSAAACVIQ